MTEENSIDLFLMALAIGVFLTYWSYFWPEPWPSDAGLIVGAILRVTFGAFGWRSNWIASAARDARLPVSRRELTQLPQFEVW